MPFFTYFPNLWHKTNDFIIFYDVSCQQKKNMPLFPPLSFFLSILSIFIWIVK